MQILETTAGLMFPEDFVTKEDREKLFLRIERIARVCYQSEGEIKPGSALKLVKKLINRKHWPMFDHIHVSVLAMCDRGVSHEIVRHRLAAYAQESTRYCNYHKDKFNSEIKVIDIGPHLKNPKSYDVWQASMKHSETCYNEMIDLGESPQIARSVLPNSLKTIIVMTYDLTVWRHFFQLRTAHAAHPQMVQIMKPLLKIFKNNIPFIFDDINND